MRILSILLPLLLLSTANAADIKTVALVDFNTCPKPEWPKESLRKEEMGTVRLKFLIDEEGNILDTLLRSSSGSALLDEAAIKGIQRCKFKPMTVNGVAVSGWTNLEYRWTLDTDEIIRQTMANVAKYRAAALAGDVGAIYKLASIFRDGVGVPFNNDNYLKLLRASAQGAYAEAEYELAAIYYYGRLQPKDMEQAVAWYTRAATHGSAPAQLRLGELYESGNGVPLDMEEAADWYGEAAQQGDHGAENALARLYDTGQGVAQNTAEAAVWYRKSADAGNADACYGLGMLYLRSKQPEQAALWLNKAAQQRHEAAENALANLYFAGTGVALNDAEGFKYLRRAALAGNASAMRQLGLMLTQGMRTVADSDEGSLWLAKAARVGLRAEPGEAVHFEL